MFNNNNIEEELNDYKALTLEDWINHEELYVQFSSDLIIPTPGRVHNQDLVPITLMICESIQGQYCDRPFIILLDGGNNGCMINKGALLMGETP